MKFVFSTLMATTALSLLPTLAHADSAADDAGAIVVSASRLPLEAREIGSAYTVVSREDLNLGQITFAKEVFQDLAGVQVTTDRPGDNVNISVRGSDNDQVLFLIDGIELGDPSSTSTQYQADHLITADIERIELLRGNQSSLYGSDAIGGVVNIITRRATEDGVRLSAQGEYGAHNTWNGGASLLGKHGKLDYRVTATGYSHDGPSLADPKTGPATEKDAYWRYGISGRTGYQATDTVELLAIGFWQKADSDLDNTGSDNDNTVTKTEYAFAGQSRYHSRDGRLNADATASRYVAERLYYGPTYPDYGDLYRGTKDSASANINYKLNDVISLAAGGNWEREKTKQVTQYSGDFLARVTTKSAYGEVAVRPVENLTVTGAARIDDNSRFGSFDTYRVTGAYVIDDAVAGSQIKLRASYGTGAKAPGLYQLFDPTYGNPNLKVETSKGGDVGIDWSFGSTVAAQVGYFFGRTRDEIVWDAGIGQWGGYTQYGRTRKSGVELALQLRPTEWLSVQQTYTYLVAEQDGDEDGVYLDMGRPKNSGSTMVTLTPLEDVSVSVRARYRSRSASSSGRPVDGYTVFDLMSSWQLNERLEVYGRVVNVFDKHYQVSWGKNSLGASAYGGLRVNF